MRVRHYFRGNNLYTVLFILLLIVFTFSRVFFINDYARSWDAVDFALGVNRFDLLDMQPHFPGYPYFILGGMLFHLFIEDPVKSLVVFNIVITATAIFPVYWISRQYVSINRSLMITLLISSLPYLNVLAIQPMSESAGIAVLCWYVMLLLFAARNNKWRYRWLPAFFFSLLMGIRVSYAVFGLGLLWYLFSDIKRYKGNKLVLTAIHAGLAISFQFIWIWGLAASLGGFQPFIKIGLAFVFGHFQDWGGTAIATGDTFMQRIAQLIGEQWLWNSWFVQSYMLGIATTLILLLQFQWNKDKKKMDSSYYMIAIMALGYFLWVLFAQNIDKPRHIMPFTLCIVLLFLIKLFKFKDVFLVYSLSALLLICHLTASFTLMAQYKHELPATYQLSAYLQTVEEPFVVYTWEETRVMEYKDVHYEHKRLLTYEYFTEEIKSTNKTIYVTGRLLEGFQLQGKRIDDKVEKVATFYSNKLFDPVYHEIELYKWR